MARSSRVSSCALLSPGEIETKSRHTNREIRSRYPHNCFKRQSNHPRCGVIVAVQLSSITEFNETFICGFSVIQVYAATYSAVTELLLLFYVFFFNALHHVFPMPEVGSHAMLEAQRHSDKLIVDHLAP